MIHAKTVEQPSNSALWSCLRPYVWAISMAIAAAHSVSAAEAVRLTDTQISTQLQTLPGWQLVGGQLHCTYEFDNFVESVIFVNRIVEPAEAVGHHPDLMISYNKVTVDLTTHDAGGLTNLDFEVAQAIADLAQNEAGVAACSP